MDSVRECKNRSDPSSLSSFLDVSKWNTGTEFTGVDSFHRHCRRYRRFTQNTNVRAKGLIWSLSSRSFRRLLVVVDLFLKL